MGENAARYSAHFTLREIRTRWVKAYSGLRNKIISEPTNEWTKLCRQRVTPVLYICFCLLSYMVPEWDLVEPLSIQSHIFQPGLILKIIPNHISRIKFLQAVLKYSAYGDILRLIKIARQELQLVKGVSLSNLPN